MWIKFKQAFQKKFIPVPMWLKTLNINKLAKAARMVLSSWVWIHPLAAFCLSIEFGIFILKSMVLPRPEPCILQYRHARLDVPTGTITVQLYHTTNCHFLMTFESCPTGNYFVSGTVIMGCFSYGWEVRSPRVEATVTILLNGHAVELSSKYLCLYL